MTARFTHCAECVFYRPSTIDGKGRCWRHPPQMLLWHDKDGQEFTRPTVPWVRAEHGCGDGMGRTTPVTDQLLAAIHDMVDGCDADDPAIQLLEAAEAEIRRLRGEPEGDPE